MHNILIKIFIYFILALILVALGLVLMFKMSKMAPKLSPFECGFNPRFNSRLPFSLQFFLVAVIFIIFDVELILLFPFFVFSGWSWNFMSCGLFIFFLIMLTIGLVVEWNQEMLNWLI